jgi:hypothetical protein
MAIASNLPLETDKDSGEKVKSFFDKYFIQQMSFPSEEIDAVVGFFEKRGFDITASNSTAIVLMQQARLDGVNVFELLDTLKGLSEVQLSAVVAEVLNYNRQKTSTLGFRQEDNSELLEKRNILL